MSNQWFKFYGGEYLIDPKMKSLSPHERSCWLTLLCHASTSEIEGVVKHLTEKQLMIDSGVDFQKEEWNETIGILERFKFKEMITIDDGVITVKNWNKKQERALTAYERTKRYRETNVDKIKARNAVQRALIKGVLEKEVCKVCGLSDTEAHHSDYSKPLEVTWLCKKHHENTHHDYVDYEHDDDRREENREEEKRISKDKYGEFEKVLLTSEEYQKLIEKIGEPNTKIMIAELDTYLASKGKKYSSHYATILSWVRRRVMDQKEKTDKSKSNVAFK